jgi:hypothetical protein
MEFLHMPPSKLFLCVCNHWISLIKYGRRRSVGITFWLDRETKISQIKISEKVLKKKLEKTAKIYGNVLSPIIC